MNKIIISCLCCVLTGFFAYGQKESDITVKKIEIDLSPAPIYTLQKVHPPPIDASKKWLVIETELECYPEWADEVGVKFYVVANYGPGAKDAPADGYDVLSTTVTIVNMQKSVGTGKKNIVPIFMDPNTVKKYAANGLQQFIPEVAVQVMYKGILQDTKWKKSEQISGRFWEKKQPKTGVLLNLMQSPWAPAFIDFYEQVKPIGTAPAAF